MIEFLNLQINLMFKFTMIANKFIKFTNLNQKNLNLAIFLPIFLIKFFAFFIIFNVRFMQKSV